MKQLTNILQQFKLWILSIAIVVFFTKMLKEIPQKCPSCNGKVRMKKLIL